MPSPRSEEWLDEGREALAIALAYTRNYQVEPVRAFSSRRAAWAPGQEVAWVIPESPVRDVIISITRKLLGGACVVWQDDIRQRTAQDVMTAKPLRSRGVFLRGGRNSRPS